MKTDLIVENSKFRATRDCMFTQDIPQDVEVMTTTELRQALVTEPFIDPFKYLELKRRGIQP